jgi:hypothetical protein
MLGRPTMPVLTWLPGRPSRGSSPPRSSCTAGLTFLTWRAEGYTTPPATAALLTDPLGWFRQHLVVVGAGLVGCLLVGFQMAILYVAAQPWNRLRSCTVTAFEPLCCKLVVSDESPQPHSACDWVRFVPPYSYNGSNLIDGCTGNCSYRCAYHCAREGGSYHHRVQNRTLLLELPPARAHPLPLPSLRLILGQLLDLAWGEHRQVHCIPPVITGCSLPRYSVRRN